MRGHYMGPRPRPLQPGPGRPRLRRTRRGEDRYDALLDSHSAPDLPALAAKLDIIVPQMAWELTGSEDCLERLRQDAHRLAAPAA